MHFADASPAVAVETSSPNHSKLQVFAVGPWHQREFCIVRQQLDPLENWPTFENLEQALADLDHQPTAPEVLLLAQPRPGFYQQALLDEYQVIAPLTRMIVVAGSWCEGELRTSKPLSGALRLYWYEFPAWWRHAITCWSDGGCPQWSLPFGDSRARNIGATTKSAGFVEIDSKDYETFAALSSAVSQHGWTTLWQPRDSRQTTAIGTSAGIWDGGQLDPPELQQLANFCRKLQSQNSPVVALLDFPRAEHIQLAAEAGADLVLAKPYFVDDLLDAIGTSRPFLP